MTEIRIQDMRLSFIWTETLLNFLDGGQPAGRAMVFLADRENYAKRFADALQGKMQDNLGPPWFRPAGEFFWTFYLGGHTPGQIQGEAAWKSLIPFRRKAAFRAKADWLPGRIHAANYFYPHGIALVFTAEVEGNFTLSDMVKKAHELRRTGKLEIEWEGRKGTESRSLDALARNSLAALRDAILGPNAAEGAQPTPFSVATIVRATGAEPTSPTEEGGEVHRALQALTTWNASYQYDALAKLDEARLHTRIAPPSHVLYGGKRGRVVWFPGLYVDSTIKRRSLGCYHRNLVFASLQTESLAGLAVETEMERSQGRAPVGARWQCAKRAAGLLGRLYGAASTTYRSSSPRLQILQNGYQDAINSLRDYFDLPQLQ